MKARLLLGIWLSIILAVVTEVRAVDQAEESKLGLRVILSQSSICQFEPCYLLVVLKNESSQAVPIKSTTWGSIIFIRQGENSKWRANGHLGPVAAPLLPTTITLEPEAMIGNCEVVTLDNDGQHFFSKPGVYWVKAKSYDLNLESEPKRLEVRSPMPDETNALQYVSEHRIYRYFMEHDARFFTGSSDSMKRATPRELEIFKPRWEELNVTGTDPTDELQSFIEHFPNSRYVQWTRMGLLFVQKCRAGQDRVSLGAAQKEMERLAPNLTAPMSSICWHSAGSIAMTWGDTTAARSDFEHALATSSDPVVRVLPHRSIEELGGASREELQRLTPSDLNLR
jgi:hypothetical protein